MQYDPDTIFPVRRQGYVSLARYRQGDLINVVFTPEELGYPRTREGEEVAYVYHAGPSCETTLGQMKLPIAPSYAMVIIRQILKNLEYLYSMGLSHGRIDIGTIYIFPNYTALPVGDWLFKLAGYDIPETGTVITHSDIARDMAGVRRVLAKLIHGADVFRRINSVMGLFHLSNRDTSVMYTSWDFSPELRQLFGKLGNPNQCFNPAVALQAIEKYDSDNMFQVKALARGAEGEVFLASKPGASFAVKTSRFHLPKEEPLARHATKLSDMIGVHPNIARILRIFCTPTPVAVNRMDLDSNHAFPEGYIGTLYVNAIMEVACGDVSIIKKPLHPRQALEVFRQIVRGLAYLHSRRMVHRDIKPLNILWFVRNPNEATPDGSDATKYSFQISDFGLASNPEHIHHMVACGTPGYMAPEVDEELEVSEQDKYKGDIYSLGVTFRELCLPRTPVSGKFETYTGIYRKECKGVPTKEKLLLPGMQRLIDDLTCDKPSSRPDAAEVLRRVEQLMENRPLISRFVRRSQRA